MTPAKEDEPCKTKLAIDLVSAVEEFHKLSSRDLSKLIFEAENGTIRYTKDNGSLLEINMESLARYLALHLMSRLLSFKRDEQHLKYLLGGLRLLHSLYNLAYRHSKLENVLIGDFNSINQILDLVFFITIFLGNFKQKMYPPILLSSMLASSLHLLKIFIPSEWQELTDILLAHPKGEVFISAAFPAVHVVIKFLQVKLSDQSDVDEVNRVCLDCEASIQLLQSLCKQKKFREHLFNNKKLCAEGVVLLLVRDIIKLPQCEDSNLNSAVSRLKSKILSIMIQICEVESVSFLDLAASTTEGLELAKSTVSEVLEMLRIMLCGNVNGVSGYKPRRNLQLNAMRLTEIISDDSNFRSYIVSNFTEVLTTVFLLPHKKFFSRWCSSDSEPVEEDVILNYDSISAIGHVFGVMSASRGSKSSFTTPPAFDIPFAHQKTSLLVKIIANFTCFAPDLCKDKRDAFINKFFKCLQKEVSDLPNGVEHGGGGGSERAAAAIRNLRSLLGHAGSLTLGFLNKDDVKLLRSFVMELEKLITTQEKNINRVKEVDTRGKSSSRGPQRSSPDKCNISDNLNQGSVDESERDANNIETIGTDLSNMQLQNASDNVPEEETVKGEEKQLKKRKRNLMNDEQISIIENALRDEPDLQRRPTTVQLWAEKLSLHGSEVTFTQLKNWLNNRKAKIAREAAKNALVASSGEADALTLTNNQVTDLDSDSTDIPADDDVAGSVLRICGATETETETAIVPAPTSCFERKPGQYVVLTDEKGEEIGKGYIHLSKGTWFDTNLQKSGLCVVDVNDLKVDETSDLPHPCDATGSSFREAELILKRKRILWESTKLLLIQQLPSDS